MKLVSFGALIESIQAIIWFDQQSDELKRIAVDSWIELINQN